MSDFAQTVKQQADIVKVIEGYIRLRKASGEKWGIPDEDTLSNIRH